MMEETNHPEYREEKHRIADAIFDFHFSEACAAAGEGDVLRVLIYDMLLPIVEEVFSEVSAQRGGYIEQLTIDLGRIDVINFKTDLKDRLRLALKSALEDQLPLLDSEHLASRKRHVLHPELSLLEHFLMKGHFPGNHMFEKGRTVDGILSAVLERSPAVFTAFLKKMKHQPQILKRLMDQSSEQRLAKLVSLLSPVDSERLLVLLKKWKQVLLGIPEMTLKPADLNHALWQTLLNFLLHEKQGNIDPRILMDRIKQKIAAGNASLEEQVSEALHGLHAGLLFPDPLVVSKEGADKFLALEALAQLKDRLITAIQTGHAENLRDIWQRVLRNHADLLKGILLDEGRRIAVRRILSRKFSDEMLGDIVTVIDPESRAFVHEIVTRPALFVQTNNKQNEKAQETKTQLWEFTLSYLILERGSHFNKKSYLGSLLAQMAAHENTSYSDLLYSFIAKLDEIEIVSGVKTEMRDLLFLLVAEEDETKKNVSPVSLSEGDHSEKQSAFIQAYEDYERLYMAFSAKTRSSLLDSALIVGLEALMRFQPAMFLRFFRTLQVEARGVQAYRHAFSAQTLLKLIQVFVGFRLQAVAQSDLMQSVEKYASAQNDLRHYYAQILFCLIQNVSLDFEAISEVSTRSPQADDAVSEIAPAFEKEKDLDGVVVQEAEVGLLRTKVIEALVTGRPEVVQGFWPAFIQTQASWLRQTLLVYGQETAVRKKWAQTFPDFMLLDMVRVLVPEALETVSKLVKQPHVFQKKSVRAFNEKENKTVFWQYTLGALIAQRGSRFNKKSYLSRLILQMASHRNTRSEDILQALTEGFEAIEISRTAKSEILLILRELSQEGRPHKIVMDDGLEGTQDVFDVVSAFQDLKYFLIQGVWSKNDARVYTEASFLKMLDRLFQSHRAGLSRLFSELQSVNLFSTKPIMNDPPDIFARLIVIFLSLENSGRFPAASEFMQAMISHALRANNQGLYYQKIFACLIAKDNIDFEAMLSETRSLQKIQKKQRDDTYSLKADLAFFEKILQASTILSAQVQAQFLSTLETLLSAAPQDLARLLRKGLEGRGFAFRLIHLLPEFLLARLLLLLNPMVFEAILRCSDLIVSAACNKEVSLSPTRMSRLKWQFIFQYLFEEGRRFQLKSFVLLLSESLARDAYYSDFAAFRALLRTQLESHHRFVMKDEVSELVKIFSPERDTSLDRSGAKKSVSDQISDETSPEPSETSQHYFEKIEAEWDETIHLENAGLVIAAPYFERFFALLNLTEGRGFKHPEAARRAVHLLQFLVDASTDSPEYQLVLNKILCGVSAGTPIERDIVMTAHEIEMAEGLLQGMITNWTQIGKTSLQGFRESFLQREGVLHRQGEDWQLEVEAKSFDILLDYLPWSFSVVKFPWMQGVIHVKWRSDEGT